MIKENGRNERRLKEQKRRSTDQNHSTINQENSATSQTGLLIAGSITIDDRCKLVYVEGIQKRLTPKEYALLRLLAGDVGKVVTSAEIITRLWPENTRATTSDVKQFVLLLRKKIERDPHHPTHIMNAKGSGYYLKT
jgi:two-component system KDP operon response regulator KdpE